MDAMITAQSGITITRENNISAYCMGLIYIPDTDTTIMMTVRSVVTADGVVSVVVSVEGWVGEDDSKMV